MAVLQKDCAGGVGLVYPRLGALREVLSQKKGPYAATPALPLSDPPPSHYCHCFFGSSKWQGDSGELR